MATLNSLTRCLEELRKLDEQMPMQRAVIFLLIAQHKSCTMQQLSEWTGHSVSTCNRNTAALSTTHWNGKPGLGVVSMEPDPNEPRRKLITLSASGRRIVASLEEYLK